jgi:large subunit ribosomal protein L19
MSKWIQAVEQDYLKQDLPKLEPGASVRVSVRIREGNKERTQAYEGVIIKVCNGGLNKTITVRRVFQGVAIERVFLVHSPRVEAIKVIRLGKVRRAKLYYLRGQIGKAARIKEKVTARPPKKGQQRELVEAGV